MASNSEVAMAWAGQRECKAKNFSTDGTTIWSYALKIGEWIKGRMYVYEYTAKYCWRSATTSQHVSRIRSHADVIIDPSNDAVIYPAPDELLTTVAKIVGDELAKEEVA